MAKPLPTALVVLLLLWSLSLGFPFSASAQVVSIPTVCGLVVAPNPVGVGQTDMLNFSVSPPPPASNRFVGLVVSVTSPDGTRQILGPFISDMGGNCFVLFTPTQIGTYSFQTSYSGQLYSPVANLTYLPSTSAIVMLFVQQAQVQTPTPNPTPMPSPTPLPVSSAKPIANTNSNTLPYDQQAVVRLQNGTLVAAFSTNLLGTVNNYAVYVKSSTDNGSTWLNPTKISNATGMDGPQCVNGIYGSVIASDAIGNVYVAWTGVNDSSTYFQVWCAKYLNGSGWEKPVRVSQGASAGVQAFYTSITIDGNDNVHLVWDSFINGYTYERIFYSKYDGSVWSMPQAISAQGYNTFYNQQYPDIAVDRNNRLHVVWSGRATGMYSTQQILYAQYNGAWQEPVDISSPRSGLASHDMTAPAVAVGFDGTVHVVWSGIESPYSSQIWYSSYAFGGVGWSYPTRISNAVSLATSNQQYPSIATDSSGDVHVIWENSKDHSLIYANNTSSGAGIWSAPVQLEPAGSTYVHLRWSHFPQSNRVTSSLDYIFLKGSILIFDSISGLTSSSLSVTIAYVPVQIITDQTINFSATATGGSPPYRYQWYINNQPYYWAMGSFLQYTTWINGTFTVSVRVTDAANFSLLSEPLTFQVTSRPQSSLPTPSVTATATPSLTTPNASNNQQTPTPAISVSSIPTQSLTIEFTSTPNPTAVEPTIPEGNNGNPVGEVTHPATSAVTLAVLGLAAGIIVVVLALLFRLQRKPKQKS